MVDIIRKVIDYADPDCPFCRGSGIINEVNPIEDITDDVECVCVRSAKEYKKGEDQFELARGN